MYGLCIEGHKAHKPGASVRWPVFLSVLARRLSWKQTAQIFSVSWDSVCPAVASLVGAFGLVHRDLTGITSIGVPDRFFKGLIHRFCGGGDF